MSAPQLISGLSDIADAYDVLLCDVWGVVHNGRTPYPKAMEALVAYRERGGAVVLISNAPRPGADVIKQLDRIGVPRAAWQAVTTSGDATIAELRKRAPGPAWAIGPERDQGVYQGTGVTLTDKPDEAAFISCTGLFDDEADQPEDYRPAFREAARRGLEMVCANPDRVVHRGQDLIWCAGALADVYAEEGGPVIMAGKPFGPIYDLALEQAAGLLGREIDRSRVLCVGDGLPTDVLGANAQGLDCLFVAGGIHIADVTEGSGGLDPARAEAWLSEKGAHARYVSLELTW